MKLQEYYKQTPKMILLRAGIALTIVGLVFIVLRWIFNMSVPWKPALSAAWAVLCITAINLFLWWLRKNEGKRQ